MASRIAVPGPASTVAWLGALGGALLMGCSVFGDRSGYEAPPYEVVESLGERLEVRRYGARLAAETRVVGADRDAAMSEAFRILAGYIFARSRGGEKVSMTVPVEVEGDAGEIGMTAPVETADTASGVAMRFFMPARFTRETLPPPEDARVRVVERPPETVAVLRFSGLGRSGSVAQRRGELLAALEDSRWRPAGEPSVLYYDPPWTLPFLRRNELIVPVEERPDRSS